jgi:pyruvate,water dikinase
MSIPNRFKHWTHQLIAPGSALRERYAAFRSLLAHDKRAHELMAELEDIFYQRRKRDFTAVQRICAELSLAVGGIVGDLSRVSPGAAPDLQFFYRKIDTYIRYMTDPAEVAKAPPYTCALDEIRADDLGRVGGKALNLGILKNTLTLPVPEGFVVTTSAQHFFFEQTGLRAKIDARLAAVDMDATETLEAASGDIRDLILATALPQEIGSALNDAYRSMAGRNAEGLLVAMRSSAVGEDAVGKDAEGNAPASFAGQYLSVLNVGPRALCDTYKQIIAGKYAPEAIAYRIRYGLTDLETPMAVLVLEMVAAVSSGVVYTADMENPDGEHLKIHAIWGLGELLVSGQTPADIFTVSKHSPHAIIGKQASAKTVQLVRGEGGGTVSEALDPAKADTLSLDDHTVGTLARWAAAIDAHYRQPQDIEWAVDPSGRLFLLQSRPLDGGVSFQERPTCTFEELPAQRLLDSGECAAGGIAAGVVYNTSSSNGADLQNVPQSAVLVTASALPHYAKVMDRVSAVVTAAGSTAGHLAIVAREFGLPMLVNAREAGRLLSHGQTVTVHADDGAVYAGRVAEMLASPCAKVDPIIDTPFMRKLEYILAFVASLELVDPQSDTFTARHCRSFHDIIRFAHEKAVQEMFHISDNRLRKLSFAKKLVSDIPMLFYVLDVGGGLQDGLGSQKEISIESVRNRAMRALWQGLRHPEIQWGSFSHFDWEAHDRMVMSGGIASPESTMFASHAVISEDYMNLNLRFGYHFVIVDALCGVGTSEQTILFRFSGGGAEMAQRMLRTEFLSKILRRLGFEVNVKSDLIDGQFKGTDAEDTLQRLDLMGRLLGATRLMDMYLKEAGQIDGFVDDFMDGRYNFATVDID